MSVTLPDWMSPNDAQFELIDTGIWARSPLGGAASRTDRPGNRMAVTFTYPPIKSDLHGAEALAALVKAKSEGLTVRWEQGKLKRMIPGSPVLDGADQQGTGLTVRGAQPNTVFRAGQVFSLEHDGGHYLHMIMSEAIADNSGDVSFVVEPRLRVIADDGDALDFNTPVIDGIIDGEAFQWQLDLAGHYAFSITVEERG